MFVELKCLDGKIFKVKYNSSFDDVILTYNHRYFSFRNFNYNTLYFEEGILINVFQDAIIE